MGGTVNKQRDSQTEGTIIHSPAWENGKNEAAVECSHCPVDEEGSERERAKQLFSLTQAQAVTWPGKPAGPVVQLGGGSGDRKKTMRRDSVPELDWGR